MGTTICLGDVSPLVACDVRMTAPQDDGFAAAIRRWLKGAYATIATQTSRH